MTPGEFQYVMGSSGYFVPEEQVAFFKVKKDIIRVSPYWTTRNTHWSKGIRVGIFQPKDISKPLRCRFSLNYQDYYESDLESISKLEFLNILTRFITDKNIISWSISFKREIQLKQLL
jgi:hypothetical protein